MKKFFEYTLIESLEEIDYEQGSPTVINCLNPHSFVCALDDELFHKALTGSSYLLPDGEGICYAMRRYKNERIAKIAGDDLHHRLLDYLDSIEGKAFYMGSSEEILERIERRLSAEHPLIRVKTLSPSYCAELPEDESRAILAEIQAFGPDVVFVSMTAPKQEKWVYRHLDGLRDVKVVANVGAAFSFYSGAERRASRIMITLRMEWLCRLLKRPRKIWRRVFVSTPRFLKWVREN